MEHITYVGLDVHKATVSVAVAEHGRAGEVRQMGVSANRPDVLSKMAARLAKSGRRISFCYEAGPCGYGLQRRLAGDGHDCIRGGAVADPDEVGRPGEDRSGRDATTLANRILSPAPQTP